jgi:exopolysaccharide biosynthesis polyprenyl glycosylphosphotransferase
VTLSYHSPSTSENRERKLAPEADAAPLISSGAGNDESIPRIFLALADIAALGVAFAATAVIAPWMQWLLLPSGPLSLSLPAWMSLPAAPAFDQFPPLASLAWVFVVTAPITVLFMDLFGGYRPLADQSRVRLLACATLSPLIALSLLTLAFFALKMWDSSRVFIFSFALLSAAMLGTYRSLLRSYKRRRLAAGMYAKNVLLIGGTSSARWLAQHFRDNVSSNRYRACGWLTTGAADQGNTIGLMLLGSVEGLSGLLINNPIHEVIAVQSSGERDWLRQVIEDCDYFRVRLRIVPEALLIGSLRDLKLMFRSDPLRLPEVVLAPPHVESDTLFLKRLIDIVVSAILLLLLAPLFLAVAVGIKLTTPHLPVFYPWRVIGLKGRPFTGFKFSTMQADAEARREELQARNEMRGPVFKVKDDPRVTRFGYFLRKYSINELPQLWSVLKGDMSLVGPRPAFRHELDRYQLWHKRKLCVKPGMTCLWQVSGRNRINDFDDWVKLDLEYIDNWSLWLDARILARTVWAVVSGSGS